MVLYRKYRPQNISDLDIVLVRDRLKTVLSSGQTPHALLFSGPKGTGKTSAARIVAKALNCEKRSAKSSEPCNTCETCVSITEGRNLDVLEIDAASNRGIDEIRNLKETIRLSPTSARLKVYIIDEVHMLTTEAFNALLKTLEEPPGHAVFILATTEPEKLLPTIISRCVKFDFTKATNEEIVHSLERVVKGEKLALSDTSLLTLIATEADGSFRDATKMLEQAILEDALNSKDLRILLGMSGSTDVSTFLSYVFAKDTKNALTLLSELEKRGANFKTFTSSILHVLHALMLKKYGVDAEKIEGFSEVKTTDIDSLLRLFTRSYGEFRTTLIPSLPLEMVVVEWGEKED